MRAGAGPREAVERTLAANPRADAGLIALALDGTLHAADTALATTLPDRGGASLQRGHGRVAVLHNAIQPATALAAFLAEAVLLRLDPPAVAGTATLRRGTPVGPGTERCVRLDAQGEIEAISIPEAPLGPRPRSMGIGYRANVRRDGAVIGRLLDDPFLIVEGGAVTSVDGQNAASLRYAGAEDWDMDRAS